MNKNFDKDALRYHKEPIPGKVDVQSSKECDSEAALSLAYSPGVAAPCVEIAKHPDKAYDYTTKGNLVGVITNGTAVLGLGDIGPLASKPVMEGKGVLFKQFAGINVFDIELEAKDTEQFIAAVKAMEPTFGGINLEDIAAPQCFIIEERLKAEMNIPVFHDDQHGTAIISAAALINAAKIQGKKLKNLKMVINGAGAAAVSCGRLFFRLGVQPKNVIMCDSRGVIYKGRPDGMNQWKEEFANQTKKRTLAEALDGADCFVGLSVAGAVTKPMVKSMAKKPIIFAMANPEPEISPKEVKAVRDDCIMATGRSDYPNQVNNVLGFPFIFRGALDAQATHINEEMKMAAVTAIAELACEEVPDSVTEKYDDQPFSFGPEYIIPKPFDPRVLLKVAPAVAKAAMQTKVARRKISDFDAYREQLEALQSRTRGFIRDSINMIKSEKRKRRLRAPVIYFPEGRSSKVLKALNVVVPEEVCTPVLLGNPVQVRAKIEELELDNLEHIEIIDPNSSEKEPEYTTHLYETRKRKGVLLSEAERLAGDPYYHSSLAVHLGDADALVCGASRNYADCVKPILEIIGAGGRKTASGLNAVLFKNKMIFFADTTVNIDPTAQQIANIAIHASRVASYFGHEPRIALLSYTNFVGEGKSPRKMRDAVELIRTELPNVAVDGEMQADTAVNPSIIDRIFPFCEIKDGANILIFPNLDSANIAYKLVQQLGEGEVLGPFLMGIKKPANVIQRTGTVDDLVNTIVLTALESIAYQSKKKPTKKGSPRTK